MFDHETTRTWRIKYPPCDWHASRKYVSRSPGCLALPAATPGLQGAWTSEGTLPQGSLADPSFAWTKGPGRSSTATGGGMRIRDKNITFGAHDFPQSAQPGGGECWW